PRPAAAAAWRSTCTRPRRSGAAPCRCGSGSAARRPTGGRGRRTRRRRAARAWSRSRARRGSARSPPSRGARAAPGWTAGRWPDPRAPGRERQAWRRGARGAKSRPVAHVVIAGAGPAGASLAYLLARRGLAVRDLVREGERVVGLRFDTPAGSREVRGDLVIGADGRASVLRARAGLLARRAEQAFDVVWCKVPQPAFLDRGTARAYLGHRHFAFCFPSYDGRLQLGWIIDKGSFGDLRRLGIEGWIEEMARHVSPDLAAHLRAEGRAITHPFLLDVV